MNKPVLARSKAITIFLVFALGYFISTLLRAITATISPELVSEFNLTSGELGLLGGGYFLGFASVQIPLGYLLDLKGPRKIVSYFLSIAIIGIILFALAQNFLTLLISRVIIGIGVGACLMGPLTAYRVWYQDETQQRSNSWMLMVGAVGMLFSSLPVQYLLPIIGWRGVFINLSILTTICIILTIIFIPKWNIKDLDKNPETGTLREIWKNNFFRSLVPMGLFNYGGLFAIQTLWAGPWMVRVSGYTPEESAKGLFMIYFFMLISFLIWGYFVPKISKNINDAIKLLKFGTPFSLIILGLIIYLGPDAGAFHWTLFVVAAIFLSLSQPAVGMAFTLSNAGKALTSFNLLLFVGAFFVGLPLRFGVTSWLALSILLISSIDTSGFSFSTAVLT